MHASSHPLFTRPGSSDFFSSPQVVQQASRKLCTIRGRNATLGCGLRIVPGGGGSLPFVWVSGGCRGTFRVRKVANGTVPDGDGNRGQVYCGWTYSMGRQTVCMPGSGTRNAGTS